jgi:hypothetical protein
MSVIKLAKRTDSMVTKHQITKTFVQSHIVVICSPNTAFFTLLTSDRPALRSVFAAGGPKCKDGRPG